MIKTQDKMGKVVSWVVVDKATGKPVAEIYEQRTVERINTEKYEIWTAYEWLVHYNHSILNSITGS